MNEQCPICEEGYLTEQIDQEVVEYEGYKGIVPTYYSICDACGSEQADVTQTRRNKHNMINFMETVKSLL